MRNDAAALRVADQVSDVDHVIPASEDDSGYDAAGGDAVDHSPTPVMWVNTSHAPG